VVVGLVALLPAASPSWAQESTPSPKELWEAYPLEPGQQAPTASPAAAATAAPTRPVSDTGGGGIPLAVPIGLAALLAFGAGVGLGRRRRARKAAVSEAPPPVQPTPRRFEWRDYPPPARPAPPPPIPGRTPPRFEAGLESDRGTPALRAKQEGRR
jgi:hypothetical protein